MGGAGGGGGLRGANGGAGEGGGGAVHSRGKDGAFEVHVLPVSIERATDTSRVVLNHGQAPSTHCACVPLIHVALVVNVWYCP